MVRCVLVLLFLLRTGGMAAADLYNYGAIVFDQGSLDWSYSINWGSPDQAVADAMRRCKGKCSLVGTFWNNCSSLAASADGTYGWDGDEDKIVSQRRALTNCTQIGGTDCRIMVSICNDIPQPTTTGAPYDEFKEYEKNKKHEEYRKRCDYNC
ncbi:MAG: hypothetical protein JWM91_288 [Rhodospirillales bacterium]|nr:hypothetical protein [Rhodospirillales bacterium]